MSDVFHVSQLRIKSAVLEGFLSPENNQQVHLKPYKDGSTEVEIERLVKHQRKAKGFLIYIKFLGEDIPDNYQWVRMSELKKTAPDLLQSYAETHPELLAKL